MDTLVPLITEHAKKILGEKAWTADLLLHVGVELAKLVNSAENLSGKQKTELVCQTILGLLDDAEKAEKEHEKESTETAKTTTQWAELRMVVKTLLPEMLHLVISAARGKFSDLQKKQISQAVSSVVPSEIAPVVAPAVEVAETVLCGLCLPLLWKSCSRKSSTLPVSHETPEPPKAQASQETPPGALLQIRQPESASQGPQNAESQNQA